MEQANLISLFTQPLEVADIDYMVTGSIAATAYGIPRLTHDIDLVLNVPLAKLDQIPIQFPLEKYYCPPDEVLLIEARRTTQGHFNLIHHSTGYKADVYLYSNDPLHHWGMAHRRRVKLAEGVDAWLAPPEYVIVRKLEYYREGGSEKHLADIRGILDISGQDIDRQTLQRWIIDRILDEYWRQVQKVS